MTNEENEIFTIISKPVVAVAQKLGSEHENLRKIYYSWDGLLEDKKIYLFYLYLVSNSYYKHPT